MNNMLHYLGVIKNKFCQAKHPLSNLLFAVLLAGIIVNHTLWVWHYALSVPFVDDYVTILNRLVIFRELHGSETFNFFYSVNDVHRLIFLNTVIVAIYKTIGNFDFHTIIFIGNSTLFLLLFAMWKYAGARLPVTDNHIKYFLPVALLVFLPAYFEASLWAVGVLQNLPVLLFAFLAVAFAAQFSVRYSIAALFFALLASATTANGMAAFPACAAILLMHRRYAHAALVLCIFAFIAWAYTRGFPNAPDNLGVSIAALPEKYASFFLTLAGAIVWGGKGAVFLGAMLTFTFIVLTWKGLHRKNPALWGFGVFLLLSMAMMTMGRASFGSGAAFVSRYKPYSGLMLAIVYMGLFYVVNSDKWKKIIWGMFLPIVAAAFISYLTHYSEVITDFSLHPKLTMAYRGVEGNMKILSGFPESGFANHVIDTSERYEIYRPGNFKEFIARPVYAMSVSNNNELEDRQNILHIYEFIDGEMATLIYGAVERRCESESYLLTLKNADKILFFDLHPPDWGWLKASLIYPIRGRVGAIVDKRTLPSGSYQVGISCNDKAPAFTDWYILKN